MIWLESVKLLNKYDLYKLSCNPEQSGYKMIANMKDYTISCREDQTLCRRALCECDLEFASKITSFPDFALSHNHTLLQRNGFDFEKSCPKRGTPGLEEISCCGDRKSFPNVSIMNGKKDSCCGNLAYNSNREG